MVFPAGKRDHRVTRRKEKNRVHRGEWRTGIIAIANATVVPVMDPADGGILYIENGALTYRGSNGTVTMTAPA